MADLVAPDLGHCDTIDDAPRRDDTSCLLAEIDDRIRHLERIAALRHPELYGDPEGAARQLAGQSEPTAPTTPTDASVVDPW